MNTRPSLRHAGAPRARGFTLFEMLAVILLIGIAAAAVSVSVSQGLKGARVSAASGELAAALRATRAEAIVKGQERHFDVDTRAGSYRGANEHSVRLPDGLAVSITSAKEDQVGPGVGRIRASARRAPDLSARRARPTVPRRRPRRRPPARDH